MYAVDADRLEGSPESSSPRVPRNEVPGLVIMEMGYAVNQTDAFSIAARGSGLARVLPHAALARELRGECLRVLEHRLLDEPADVRGVGAARLPNALNLRFWCEEIAQPTPRSQPFRPCRIALLVVADLACRALKVVADQPGSGLPPALQVPVDPRQSGSLAPLFAPVRS